MVDITNYDKAEAEYNKHYDPYGDPIVYCHDCGEQYNEDNYDYCPFCGEED